MNGDNGRGRSQRQEENEESRVYRGPTDRFSAPGSHNSARNVQPRASRGRFSNYESRDSSSSRSGIEERAFPEASRERFSGYESRDSSSSRYGEESRVFTGASRERFGGFGQRDSSFSRYDEESRVFPETSRDRFGGFGSRDSSSSRSELEGNHVNRPYSSSRGGFRGNSYRPNEKRGRDQGSDYQMKNKVARKSGGRGGRNGSKKEERPEFSDLLNTRPKDLKNKTAVVKAGDNSVELVSNFFKIDRLDERSTSFYVYQYRVTFQPKIFNPGLKRKLMDQHKREIGVFVYDGNSQIYLASPCDIPCFWSRDNPNQKMSFNRERDISFTEGNFLTVLNLVFRNSMISLDYELMMKNYFDQKEKIDDFRKHGIEIWPGYKTSVRQHERNLLLNCHLIHKFMRNESVYDFFRRTVKKLGQKDDYRKEVGQKLIGMTILTTYANNTYKISDIDWKKNPLSTFKSKNGDCSYADYFKRKYQIDIKDMKQPLLKVKPTARDIRGKKKEIELIPELCKVLGIDDDMKKDFDLMKQMSERTKITPQEMVNRLNSFNSRMLGNLKCVETLTDNGMKLNSKLVQVKAKELKNEDIFVKSENFTAKDGDWGIGMQKRTLLKSVPWTNWHLIYPKQAECDIENLLQELKLVTEGYQIMFTRPTSSVVTDDKFGSYKDVIQNAISKEAKFIMIILMRNNGDLYSKIKRLTIFAPNLIPVQVVLHKTIQKDRFRSVASKIAIQINCKLGGIPWTVELNYDGLMVVGFDFTRDVSEKKTIYRAMVACSNPHQNGGKFFTKVRKIDSNISECTGDDISMAVQNFQKENGVLPKQILIYRDGVGDGQIENVRDTELKSIKNALRMVYRNVNLPKVIFVIVNKRTNARFMLQGKHCHENPRPGTVIDDTVTFPERFDFYLISHQANNQGTVSPTYYNVIENGSEFWGTNPQASNDIGSDLNTPEGIQRITYKLCHLYFNWSGSTKIPSVVQYAKKLAFLVGQHLHDLPRENFRQENQLFFL